MSVSWDDDGRPPRRDIAMSYAVLITIVAVAYLAWQIGRAVL